MKIVTKRTNDIWWRDAVIYQIYPKSFCDSNGDGIGDLKGVISKLDYLEKLGIDAIWFSPIFKSPNVDNGYDISDYYAIADEYGTMEDFDELMAEAKKRGIRIILDLVVNHSSSEHKWFKEAQKSKDNPYRDYYIWRDPNPETGKEPSEIGAVFGGSAWEFQKETGQYYLHMFAVEQPDLNWENPKMRAEIYKMMNFWLEKGVAGFRMDVIDMIGKDIDNLIVGNGPHLHKFLHEMNRETFGKYDTLTVGETGGVTPEIANLFTDPKREEISMCFQFSHVNEIGPNKIEAKPFTISDIKKSLSDWQKAINEKCWIGMFWSNHDQPRPVSRWGNEGEYREKSAKALCYLLHLMKGTPYIYFGEELGMTNTHFNSVDEFDDIEAINAYHYFKEKGVSDEALFQINNRKGRDTGRTPFHWDDSKNAGFTTGETTWIKLNSNYKEVNAKSALADKSSVFYDYQKLINFRKGNDLIVWGDYSLLDTAENVFAYVRSNEEQKLLVVANMSREKNSFSYNAEIKETLIQNTDKSYTDLNSLTLEPFEAFAVFVKESA